MNIRSVIEIILVISQTYAEGIYQQHGPKDSESTGALRCNNYGIERCV